MAQEQGLLQWALEKWAFAVELRDSPTAGHCQRVAHNSYEVAKLLEVNGTDIISRAVKAGLQIIGGVDQRAVNAHVEVEKFDAASAIYWAGMLHDLGKIAVHEDILNKNGKLNKQEWLTMKSHVPAGVALLSGSGSPKVRLISEGVHTHHEWWDGSGYPRALKEEDIWIGGRIITVCDVFEAMSTRRSYHAAMPVEEALEHVEGLAGKQFDPDVVMRFRQLFDAGEIFDSRYPMPPEERPAI